MPADLSSHRLETAVRERGALDTCWLGLEMVVLKGRASELCFETFPFDSERNITPC